MAAAFKIYTSNYYKADTATIEEIESAGDVKIIDIDDDAIVFEPEGEYTTGIVFYPGGKVEYSAYAGLMYKLAEEGYVCVLVRMPENLAFLDIDAADGVSGYFDDVDDWYLAGHSLGGVAASLYLGEQIDADTNEYDGIILLASYSTYDFSDTDIRVLSIYGSNDGILNMESYEDSKENVPADFTEYIIDGGIHSYFGCYGIQDGDGEPLITNIEQIEETTKVISDWINDAA